MIHATRSYQGGSFLRYRNHPLQGTRQWILKFGQGTDACKAIIHGTPHEKGELGDGKIFVTTLEECIRIRTEEKGTGAI